MKLLSYYHTDPHGKYIDFCEDIVGNSERGIRFTLSYMIDRNEFYASIHDTDGYMDESIEYVQHDVAKFMIGKKEYDKLEKIHKEEMSNAK